MKVSFVTTVFNEARSITQLLDSLSLQTILPNDAIFIDGGSTDDTVSLIQQYQFPKEINVKVLIKNGNRSIGRNEAIRHATNDIILISDAGCVLDKNWVESISEPFSKRQVDVVAGYYRGKAETLFQKALIPYVLVMEDKVIPKNFLPATRSMALRKRVWEKVGGFDESLSHNEDYVFARKLKVSGVNIVFAKEAIVYWIPRKNSKEAFIMFFRFAYGDAEAGILRPKVLLLFLRYGIGLIFLLSFVASQDYRILYILLTLGIFYALWATIKNYKYVHDLQVMYILPFLQITSDFAVMVGTCSGIFKRYILFT